MQEKGISGKGDAPLGIGRTGLGELDAQSMRYLEGGSHKEVNLQREALMGGHC